MKFKLAISTCPNDTFMFDALVNNRIDTLGHKFELELADIEQLNSMLADNQHDISKVSFHAFAKHTAKYQMLRSGAAIGFGNGPLIISKKKIYPDELRDVNIGIPGTETTANLLLSILYPECKNKTVYLFSDIEEALLENEIDAGVIIHETRFSYTHKGLKFVADLGQLWEEKFQLPLPLGGIAIKRGIDEPTKKQIEHLISESVRYAKKNPEASYDFVKKHAQDLDQQVINKHIALYVNNYSIDCGLDGMDAMEKIIKKATNQTNSKIINPLFL